MIEKSPQQIELPAEEQNQFLTGEREVGAVPLPGGSTAVHEVTPDGMKQTRIVGPARPSRDPKAAYEEYLKIGQPELNDVTQQERGSRVARVFNKFRR